MTKGCSDAVVLPLLEFRLLSSHGLLLTCLADEVTTVGIGVVSLVVFPSAKFFL